MKVNPLTPLEKAALQRLSWGHPYCVIAEKLKISPAHLHTITNMIRRKTGIRDTKDPQQCKHYLATRPRHGITSRKEMITPGQLRALRVLAKGTSLREASMELGISYQTLVNVARSARMRARIGDNSREAIVEYLRKLDAPENPMDDPCF